MRPTFERRAKEVYSGMTQADIDVLVTNIASALPGSTTDPLTIPQFRDRLQQYRGIDSAVLRRHLSEFLARVTPVAESLGVTLTLHPDDPPRPLFGLPRIASSAEDYQALFDAVPSKANGICFCTGSLGVRAENDLPAMAKRFAPRIGFAHLRATKREGDGLSFFESDHLDGDVDMIAVLKALLAENKKRSSANQIVFRPDHGHRMLDDLAETETDQSRLYRDRPAARARRTARRHPRHRTRRLLTPKARAHALLACVCCRPLISAPSRCRGVFLVPRPALRYNPRIPDRLTRNA